MSKNRMPRELGKFAEIFEPLARSHGSYHVFEDFLDLSINAWSLDHRIDLAALQKKYTKKERAAFGLLIRETISILERTIKGDADCYDVFGTFYEANSLTSKHFAQFFTPMEICRLMAALTGTAFKKSFSDPCSGSARLSLAANATAPGMFHCLIDIDYTCARMSALNLMYHGIHGIVICDNGLFPGKHFKGAFIVNRKLMHQRVPEIEFLSDIDSAYHYPRTYLGMAQTTVKPGSDNKESITEIEAVGEHIMTMGTNQFKLF